jgi:hypothetical protein
MPLVSSGVLHDMIRGLSLLKGVFYISKLLCLKAVYRLASDFWNLQVRPSEVSEIRTMLAPLNRMIDETATYKIRWEADDS